MRLIGLIGGLSWESTVEYYRIINRGVRDRLGADHSARLLLYSVDFEPIHVCQRGGRWEEAGRTLLGAARALEAGGAEFLLLCTNTMHKVAGQIETGVGIPLIHIADATAGRIRSAGLGRVGLLGTRYTMGEEFYRGRLEEGHGLQVLIPPEEDRTVIDRVIFDELCRGEIREASRREYVRVIEDLATRGAEGVILGCTEIGLLVRPEDTHLPTFDTARIHAETAVELALSEP